MDPGPEVQREAATRFLLELISAVQSAARTARTADDLRRAMDEAIKSTQQSTAVMRRVLNNEIKRLDALDYQYMDLVGHLKWPRDKLTEK